MMTKKEIPAIFLILLTVAMVPFLSLVLERDALSAVAHHRIVRTIETGSFAHPHPAGLTYIAEDIDSFAYLPASRPGDQAPEAVISRVGFADDPQGAVALPLTLFNPLNIAYNHMTKTLFLFDDQSMELIEYPPGAGKTAGPESLMYTGVDHFGLGRADGMTIDPISGDLFILDSVRQQIVRIQPPTTKALRGGEAYRSGRVTRIPISGQRRGRLRGIAYNPFDRHLYVFQPDSRKLFEFSMKGKRLSVRDLSQVPLRNPQGMVFAPSGDRTDDPANTSLYLADSGLADTDSEGQIIEISLAEPVLALATAQSTLVRTIDTSQFSPPSPDPAGLAYQTDSDQLLFSDSEVNEMSIFSGGNLFEMTIEGNLSDYHSTLSYSREPTGLAFDWMNGHLFVADDDRRRVNEIDPGSDGIFHTSDDQVTFFDTRLFDSFDPEGIAIDSASQTLFIADGVNSEVYLVRPGENGVFDGVPPSGDDQVSQFDTAGFGITDPEGIEYSDANGYLYLVCSANEDIVAEVAPDGTFVQGIDISQANAKNPSGVALGPHSLVPGLLSLYISDRKVDNGADPNENDGEIYEISLPFSELDETAPEVTAFTLPVSADSLTVTIESFVATDDIGVDGYLVTESATPPESGAAGWSASPPSSYTFSTAGSQTLYGWAKDAAGNVSAAVSATVLITLPDTTPPVVTSFSLPASADSLTVTIETFVATDDTGVDGYLVTESATPPESGAAGWSASPPSSYTFSTAGSQTLYGWAKDAAGNVSAAVSATVLITLSDTTPPVVTSFSLPESANSLTVTIETFVATDDTGVDGYLATESATPPESGAAGWSASPPSSYTFSTAGSQTLYGWAKDAAGNVSAAVSATVLITLPDTTPPVVTSFSLPASADSLTVTIETFVATDDTGVDGYLVTESATPPESGAAGWSASPPSSYTFSTAGSQTLYGWAKDAAGNVSAAVSATVLITLSDTTPPVVTSFSLPESANSLTVTIETFVATDDTGVDGYLATESATPPESGAAGWSASLPSSYTFSTAGSQTLYGWAKDAAGNVSAAVSATVLITLSDTTPPVVTSFSLPESANSLTVTIEAFVATDDTGVDGYLATESATPPESGAAGWSASLPSSYTFSAAGSQTLYGWAKDAAGNVSTAVSATVLITLPDTTPPVVTSFSLPASASSLTVTIESFVATDDTGVDGYLVTESATPPESGAAGWGASPPSSYTFSAAGSQTLYGWAKDAAGNVSAAVSATVLITDISGGGGGEMVVTETRIAAPADDAEESESGKIYLNSSDLELGYNDNSPQTVGMRFVNVDIPRGATIVEAYIEFTVDERDSEETLVTLQGEAVDNAVSFSYPSGNISLRPKTAAGVVWNIPPWVRVGDAGAAQQSADIRTIVQEIINRPGWNRGNALVIIATGSGTRVADSYNGNPGGAPLLHVVYQ